MKKSKENKNLKEENSKLKRELCTVKEKLKGDNKKQITQVTVVETKK